MTELPDRFRTINHILLLLPNWDALLDALARFCDLLELLSSYSSPSSSFSAAATPSDGDSDNTMTTSRVFGVFLLIFEHHLFLYESIGSHDGLNDIINTLATTDVDATETCRQTDALALRELIQRSEVVLREMGNSGRPGLWGV